MAEPLDIIMMAEQAKHIVSEITGNRRESTAILAGHMLVAGEIRRLTTAVENLKEAVHRTG